MESTCPIKLVFAQSRRRARLDVPLRMEQLRAQITHSFPELASHSSTIEYVDEEGDTINVVNDAELQEARRVYDAMGRVLSLVVHTSPNTVAGTVPKSSIDESKRDPQITSSVNAAGKSTDNISTKSASDTNETSSKSDDTTIPSSVLPDNTPFGPGSFGAGVVKLQHALIKLGYMRPSAIRFRAGFFGPRTSEAIARIARVIGSYNQYIFTDQIRSKMLEELKALENGELVLHNSVRCDGSNEFPLRGIRFHKIGQNYDLNATEFAKLSDDEKQAFEVIKRPGALPIPVSEYLGQSTTKKTEKTCPANHFDKCKFGFLRHPFARAMMSMAAGVAKSHGIPQIHFGITCDGSNQHPILGNRYHKIGHDYDLNETEFKKLSREEQLAFEIIAYPGAKPVPVAAEKPVEAAATVEPAVSTDAKTDSAPDTENVPVDAPKPDTENIPVDAPKSDSVPTSENFSTMPSAPSDAKSDDVQKLIDMGFQLSQSTLAEILQSVDGNIREAVSKLLVLSS